VDHDGYCICYWLSTSERKNKFPIREQVPDRIAKLRVFTAEANFLPTLFSYPTGFFMRMSRPVFIGLLLFVFFDLGFTFWQHYRAPLDGDLAGIVVPSDHYQTVLEHPLGWYAIAQDTSYAAPNRYVIHRTMTAWFRVVPRFFQNFTDPIQSVYLASAFAKTLAHGALIWLLAWFVSALSQQKPRTIWLAAAVLTPLFQTNGALKNTLSVVDLAPTYAFFYAWPVVLLLLYLRPWVRWWLGRNTPRREYALGWLLAVLLPFSGPLIPGIVGVLCLLLCVRGLWQWRQSNSLKLPAYTLSLAFLALGCLYSLYVGRYNAEGASSMGLWERYQLIPQGFWQLLTNKLGLSLLIIATFAQYIWIYWSGSSIPRTVRLLLRGMLWFSLLYVLLLPLGGYRDYRPLVVRRDTLLPVYVCLFWTWGYSTLFILKASGSFSAFRQKAYAAFVGLFCLYFTLADEPGFRQNARQREALYTIYRSEEEIVPVNDDCRVLHWDPIYDPQYSEIPARALELWGIAKRGQRFVQKNG
jgi:hypothetical protein